MIDAPKNKRVWVRPSKPQHSRKIKEALTEYWQHFGKWLIFSQNRAYLKELVRKIDRYVNEGKINSAKYNREPAPFAKSSFVMCVYCADREGEEVWKILSRFVVSKRIRKYERQTTEDWLQGGCLH